MLIVGANVFTMPIDVAAHGEGNSKSSHKPPEQVAAHGIVLCSSCHAARKEQSRADFGRQEIRSCIDTRFTDMRGHAGMLYC